MAEHAIVRDLPERIRAGHWPIPWQPVWGDEAGLGMRLGDWGVRGALAALSALPEAALEAALDAAARVAVRADRRHTSAAHAFLGQALGPLGERELARRTLQAWRHFLRVSVDAERFFRRVPFERTVEHFEVEFSDDARAALREKRGRLLVTGHLGNWEAGLSISPWMGCHPLYGVARPAKNRFLSRAVQAVRERRGVRMLNRKGAMASAPAILAAGGTIGLVVDQRASGRALLAPFFGRLARCDRSPAVLLKRQRVPVIIVRCLLAARPLHYAVRYGEVLWPDPWARAEVEEIVAHLNGALEREILACPEQYVWIHDRYRDTPERLEPGALPRAGPRAPRAGAPGEPRAAEEGKVPG